MITSDTQLAFIVRSVFILFKLNDRFTHYLIEIKCFLSYRNKMMNMPFLIETKWLIVFYLVEKLINLYSF